MPGPKKLKTSAVVVIAFAGVAGLVIVGVVMALILKKKGTKARGFVAPALHANDKQSMDDRSDLKTDMHAEKLEDISVTPENDNNI